MPIEAAPTVRESIEQAVSTVEETAAPVVAPEPLAPVETKTVDAPQETEAQKAERLRNEDGTFAKGKPAPKPDAAAAPVEVPAKPKAPRPTSWKKELEQHWDKLAPEVQAYVNEREKQYATGVSTYKTEADRAKGVMEAVNQFAPMLQSMKIEPSHWIKSLGAAHHFLSNGTPQERVQTVADIIRNNRVDVQALGQLLAGQQPQYQQSQAQGPTPLPQAQQQPVDINTVIDQAFQKREVEGLYKTFTADVEAGKYPHFADEQVQGTMAQLLEAGLAQDYPSAYDAAISMPQHRHLAAAAQPAPTPTPDKAADKQAQATRARSQAVSVKSSTPSTMTQASGAKGLRDMLSENYDKTTTSRV